MSAVTLATCQFPVSGDVRRNARYVRRFMEDARDRGTAVVHFSECALSGYAGSDFPSWDGYDWALLRVETRDVCRLASAYGLWVVLGSSHQLSPPHLPHNCLYVIAPDGNVVDRYDKRFCTGRDLRFYTPGNHCATFDVDGVRFGLLICYDVRFPELYRAYKRMGVHALCHSFYNARAKGRSIHTVIMRCSTQTRAATNAMWISANNASAYYQSWPSVFVTPDGRIAQSLRQHRAGLMLNTIDTDKPYYDASRPFRERAMNGVLNSGTTVADPRSSDRCSIG